MEVLKGGECPVEMFSNLSKAFDCVNHHVLLERTRSSRSDEIVLKWSFFLNGRTQFVEIRNGIGKPERSTTMNVEFSIPQGSILGPVLLLMCINLLLSVTVYSNITAFAKDNCSRVILNRDLFMKSAVNQGLQ